MWLLTEGVTTADWPLSRKFGCHPDMAYDLLVLAKNWDWNRTAFRSMSARSSATSPPGQRDRQGQIPFSTGSPRKESAPYQHGRRLPAHYLEKPTIETYATEITRYLREDFGDALPDHYRAGRSLVADSVLVTESLIARSRTALERWVYTDAANSTA